MKASQLEVILEVAIKNNFPVLIKGKAGVGKTDITTQSTSRCIHTDGLPFDLMVVHPVVQDPTEPGGIPWVINGEVHKLPFANMRRMINATRPLVVLIDDLGQAAISTQAAYMQVILQRELDGQPISPFVRFVAATNRKEDRAGVAGILDPLLSRFYGIHELDLNIEDWCSWAWKYNMPASLISFAQFDKDLLLESKPSKDMENVPTGRTYASAGKQQNAGIPKGMDFYIYKGAAGEVFATKYISYCNIYLQLPTVGEIENDPLGTRMPMNLSEQYALMNNISAAMTVKNARPLMQYLTRMPAELMAAAMVNAGKRNVSLMTSPEYTQWAIKNANYML